MIRPSLHNNPLPVAVAADKVSSRPQGRAPRVGLKGGSNKSYPAAERLWARTDKTSSPHGCWLVSGVATRDNGYLSISRKSERKPPILAHRLAWELLRGPVPAGLKVCHNCPGGDNPRCVNPDHLWLGTQAQNIHDSIHKGRYNTFGRQKLNAAQVREILVLAKRGFRQKDIAAQFQIARHTVSGIVHRKSWDHLDRPFVGSDPVFERVPHREVPVRGEVA